MKLGALFSGGKDSAMAAYWAVRNGHKIACLITLISESSESYMFHVPNIEWTKYQAEAMNIPQIIKKTKGEQEEELKDLKSAVVEAMKKYHIEGITAGALASNYQKKRVEKICDELNIECIAPFWNYDDEKYMNEIVENNFEVIITSVSAEGLTSDFLGKKINHELIEKLKKIKQKNRINLHGEGGEYETFVLDCPLFKKRLVLRDFFIQKDNNSASLVIKNLETKPQNI
jgi:asparagine synthase (glutamine-hydrolysing)